MYLWTILSAFSITTVRVYGADNLALSSTGATCGQGVYGQAIVQECTSAIDGTLAPYTPPPGDAWMLITLTTVATVTHVDLLFASTLANDVEIQLVVSAGADPEQYERFNIIGLPAGMYHQPFSFRQPVVTNYVTISWRTAQMPSVIDVRVFGITQGSNTILPLHTGCNNFQESQCPDTTDGSMATTMYLASGTTLDIQFDTQEQLTHLAFYSSQMAIETVRVPVTLTLVDRNKMQNQTVDVEFRNQGKNQHGTWQIVHLPEPYVVPASVTMVAPGGQFATLSEIRFFHVQKDHTTLPDIPPLGYPIGNIHTLDTVYLGKVLYTDATTVLSTMRNQSEDNQLITELPDDLMLEASRGHLMVTESIMLTALTTLENQTSEILRTIESGREVTISTKTDHQKTFMTEKVIFVTGETPVTDAPRTSLPRWFWYLIIGIGVLIIVLVIVLVITLSRMRRRSSYRPSNRRPRVMLRSVSQTSHAVSVVTPTRGYFHLTLNSQSSMPEPYSGVSPINTTTFALGYKKQEETDEYVACNERNSALESDRTQTAVTSHTTSSVPGTERSEEDRITDFELSDDCFEAPDAHK